MSSNDLLESYIEMVALFVVLYIIESTAVSVVDTAGHPTILQTDCS